MFDITRGYWRLRGQPPIDAHPSSQRPAIPEVMTSSAAAPLGDLVLVQIHLVKKYLSNVIYDKWIVWLLYSLDSPHSWFIFIVSCYICYIHFNMYIYRYIYPPYINHNFHNLPNCKLT